MILASFQWPLHYPCHVLDEFRPSSSEGYFFVVLPSTKAQNLVRSANNFIYYYSQFFS